MIVTAEILGAAEAISEIIENLKTAETEAIKNFKSVIAATMIISAVKSLVRVGINQG